MRSGGDRAGPRPEPKAGKDREVRSDAAAQAEPIAAVEGSRAGAGTVRGHPVLGARSRERRVVQVRVVRVDARSRVPFRGRSGDLPVGPVNDDSSLESFR